MSATWRSHQLRDAGPIASAFRERGCRTFGEALELTWDLPYGRNTTPADDLCGLLDSRGTCSTKHALLARLAAEQGIAADLVLGIYMMREANTPGVGVVLERHGLDAIPEAHCILEIDGERIDVTRRGGDGREPIGSFLYREVISPGQIGDYKRNVHRRVIAEWIATGAAGNLTPEEAWRIREACIAALGG